MKREYANESSGVQGLGPPGVVGYRGASPPLEAEPGKVVVSVKAASVKFSDTLIIQNKYQTKPELPFIPGAEVTGVLKSIGAGVEGWKVGDRVSAQTTYGGYAEEVSAEPGRLAAIPESIDFARATGLSSTYGTSYYALTDRGQLRAGETINYVSEDMRARVKAITKGNGVDVIYDPVGGPYSELALRDMAWGGRLLVIGFTAGDIPKIPLNLPLIKGCSIVGVWIGAFAKRDPARHRAHAVELWKWFAAGKIKPHIWATYPLEKAADALNALAGRKVAGKAILTTEA